MRPVDAYGPAGTADPQPALTPRRPRRNAQGGDFAQAGRARSDGFTINCAARSEKKPGGTRVLRGTALAGDGSSVREEHDMDDKQPRPRPHEDPNAKPRKERERALDEAVEESFPASDPPAQTQPEP